MRKYVLFGVALIFLCGCQGFDITIGSCPDVKVQRDFSIYSYMGRWYCQAIDEILGMEKKRCVQTMLAYDYAKNVVRIFSSYIKPSSNQWSSTKGVLTKDEYNTAKGTFFVRLPEGYEMQSYVLETDYNSYSIIYTCASHQRFVHISLVQLYTRNQNVTPQKQTELQERVKSVLARQNLGKANLTTIDQTNCSKPPIY